MLKCSSSAAMLKCTDSVENNRQHFNAPCPNPNPCWEYVHRINVAICYFLTPIMWTCSQIGWCIIYTDSVHSFQKRVTKTYIFVHIFCNSIFISVMNVSRFSIVFSQSHLVGQIFVLRNVPKKGTWCNLNIQFFFFCRGRTRDINTPSLPLYIRHLYESREKNRVMELMFLAKYTVI